MNKQKKYTNQALGEGLEFFAWALEHPHWRTFPEWLADAEIEWPGIQAPTLRRYLDTLVELGWAIKRDHGIEISPDPYRYLNAFIQAKQEEVNSHRSRLREIYDNVMSIQVPATNTVTRQS